MDDSECGGGQVCTAGACAPRPECTTSANCAEGFACTEGRCQCGSDAACASNQACREGRCVTRSACTSANDCPAGQRCEPTQGVCQVPCTQATDCAPGVDPRVASLLYLCRQGDCLRQCLNDQLCGAGFICEAGTCARAGCATKADCPSGQYCTSATAGRCTEFQPCDSNAQCGPNTECRAFASGACPPGFDCATKICQELPRCLVDTDCSVTAYCRDSHCQPSTACTDSGTCAPGLTCVASRCVPSGCRGHADCAPNEACTDGACRPAPSAGNIVSIALTPKTATLVVGDTVRLGLVAYTLDGASFPLAQGSFSAVDASGSPSGAVTVSPEGLVTAVSAGTVRVQAKPSGAAVSAQEATLTVLPALDSGRRVTVMDASTRRPLAGVEVLGCDAPPASGPCPAPVTVTTDSRGVALFPGFAGATASFSAASGEPRADGLPRYDRVSVASTPARDVLLPLGDNPVHGAAGFNAGISFNEVHSSGELSVGFSVLSVGDPTAVDLTNLFGESFLVSVPGLPQRLPVPSSLVAYASLGLAGNTEIKPRSYGLGQAGRRTAVAFAGKLPLAQATSLRPADLLAYSGAMDFALQSFTSLSHLPYAPDATDLDGDGLCSNTQSCQGSEDLPDYSRFTGITHRPRREQLRRMEVVLPNLPSGLDTAVIAAVELSPEAGLVPMGLASRTGGTVQPDGTRPVQPVLLRSGAPYGGAEGDTPGVWALATSATSGASVSGRIVRGPTLPTRVSMPEFLPLPTASYTPASRTFTPSVASWSALAGKGARLVRVTLTGPRGRHVVYLALEASGGALRVPDSPAGADTDPAGQTGVILEVAALRPAEGRSAEDLLDAPGVNLLQLPVALDGYSRSRPP
ncbi:hypothetical protein JRI60_29385 [Archangium violaceum]|uniref:hypothetical protein n=1 Tax=Archangium violaceum TaxID=83451 RepID=UPI001951CA6D|nr:hypothetical protein [Archangium violaceum]QRN93303.1 hypothetical protein JRI60_29385 [Archangium violaceum]